MLGFVSTLPLSRTVHTPSCSVNAIVLTEDLRCAGYLRKFVSSTENLVGFILLVAEVINLRTGRTQKKTVRLLSSQPVQLKPLYDFGTVVSRLFDRKSLSVT